MALLHYQNLEARRPDILMQSTFYGLKKFYDFLSRTKNYMESDAAVKRLAWIEGPGVEDDDEADRPEGYWVQLSEPKDRPNEPESTFQEFLDDNTSTVYEAAVGSTGDGHKGSRHNFSNQAQIVVLDRDPASNQLLLERFPGLPGLILRPNTWPIVCQVRALQALQDAPGPEHRPLLRLFEAPAPRRRSLLRLFEEVGHPSWPPFEAESIPALEGDRESLGGTDRRDGDSEGWMVLTDQTRPGTEEQRQFVRIALATPDFAFLEGPPGSGKTTAICELILQCARLGKRVLLCASTHVAVDNVLERLMDARNKQRDLVIPIRIGDSRSVSEKARTWQLQNFVRTERDRLLRELGRLSSASAAQQSLRAALSHETSVMERLVLDAANLVCGTTIGILQHPDIKGGGHASAAFDVLIVDEASKTTFQEFLVPALLAKRWVIVGDPKQLSPYVDDQAMAISVKPCLPDADVRHACIDSFLAAHGEQRRRRTAVAAVEGRGMGAYLAQAAARGVDACSTDADPMTLATAGIVVGDLDEIERRSADLPLDVATIRGADDRLVALRRRAGAWSRLQRRGAEEQPSWANEISWRLARVYDLRLAEDMDGGHKKTTGERLREQVDQLLPVAATDQDPEKVMQEIDRVRRVALPSVLESLRYGFERDPRQRQGTALSDGLPDKVIRQRHVLLATQHRMHSEIADFSHRHIYNEKALFTSDSVGRERAWSYPRYRHRAVWREVQGDFNHRYNANKTEAKVLIEELRAFDTWARANPRPDGHLWEVAVLTFYRGQEREIRGHLRRWTNNRQALRHFMRGPKKHAYLGVELCTIDRFQGHEADLVFISFASRHPTSFLESPNRLNVALTRARFQRVIIGDRKAMCRAQGSKLGLLAKHEKWEQSLQEQQS